MSDQSQTQYSFHKRTRAQNTQGNKIVLENTLSNRCEKLITPVQQFHTDMSPIYSKSIINSQSISDFLMLSYTVLLDEFFNINVVTNQTQTKQYLIQSISDAFVNLVELIAVKFSTKILTKTDRNVSLISEIKKLSDSLCQQQLSAENTNQTSNISQSPMIERHVVLSFYLKLLFDTPLTKFLINHGDITSKIFSEIFLDKISQSLHENATVRNLFDNFTETQVGVSTLRQRIYRPISRLFSQWFHTEKATFDRKLNSYYDMKINNFLFGSVNELLVSNQYKNLYKSQWWTLSPAFDGEFISFGKQSISVTIFRIRLYQLLIIYFISELSHESSSDVNVSQQTKKHADMSMPIITELFAKLAVKYIFTYENSDTFLKQNFMFFAKKLTKIFNQTSSANTNYAINSIVWTNVLTQLENSIFVNQDISSYNEDSLTQKDTDDDITKRLVSYICDSSKILSELMHDKTQTQQSETNVNIYQFMSCGKVLYDILSVILNVTFCKQLYASILSTKNYQNFLFILDNGFDTKDSEFGLSSDVFNTLQRQKQRSQSINTFYRLVNILACVTHPNQKFFVSNKYSPIVTTNLYQYLTENKLGVYLQSKSYKKYQKYVNSPAATMHNANNKPNYYIYVYNLMSEYMYHYCCVNTLFIIHGLATSSSPDLFNSNLPDNISLEHFYSTMTSISEVTDNSIKNDNYVSLSTATGNINFNANLALLYDKEIYNFLTQFSHILQNIIVDIPQYYIHISVEQESQRGNLDMIQKLSNLLSEIYQNNSFVDYDLRLSNNPGLRTIITKFLTTPASNTALVTLFKQIGMNIESNENNTTDQNSFTKTAIQAYYFYLENLTTNILSQVSKGFSVHR